MHDDVPVAILSALLSLLSRKLGDFVQALFGWSVTALFGRQSRSKQVGLSIAMLLSALWPLFIVGTIFPGAAAWALAFLPLERWLGPTVLRVVWVALALAAPLLVGAITRWAAPGRAKGSALRTILGGYPLTLGYTVSLVVTLVTVPALKLMNVMKGWTEEHAYVQPREGEYEDVLRAVAEGFARAGMTPSIEEVPGWMSVSTRALKFFARGVITPMLAENPRRVIADGVEAYLYPSDLLLRGVPRKAARVRADLMATALDRHAYLVQSREAQRVQDEVRRLWDVVREHEREHMHLGGMASTRVREIHGGLRKVNVSFEEWAVLERSVRRLERRVAGGPNIIDDELRDPAPARAEVGSITMEPTRIEEAPVTDLVKTALADARELVRLEVELARDEVKKEVKAVSHAAIGFGVGAVLALVGLSVLAMSLVLALGGTALTALIVGLCFLAGAGLAGALGYGALPKKPMEETRARVQADMQHIKENLA